jgi:hypothetical protein
MLMCVLRKLLAGSAALGLIASACIFIWSFFGGTMNDLGPWFVWLGLGVPVLFAPMILLEYATVRNRTFFWKEFGRTRPIWTVPAIKILGVFFFINFGVFLFASHFASPEVMNAEYVLSNHGQIIRTLTKTEYSRLKAGELRLFASAWICFYFTLLSYWWFPNRPSETAR